MRKYLAAITLFGLILLSFSSCGTKRKLVYFQPNDSDTTSLDYLNFQPVFKIDDIVSVSITADHPEAAIPFNLVEPTMPASAANGSYISGMPVKSGYLISADSSINLPVLGKVVVAGKTRRVLLKELSEKYSAYLENPIVNVQILNFKVTVLGDVNIPGTYQVPNERITILEALGLAGDLKITGQRKDILVIREVNGQKKEYRIDLTQKEIFSSPVYYLSQNDVVYVTPNIASRSQSTFWIKTGGIFISLTALVVSTLSVIVK